MDLQNIYYIGELVAAIAVVGSLIFLGFQMRQNTGALKATVASDMMSNWITVMSPFISSTEFIDAARQLDELDDPEDLPMDARMRLLGFWSGGMKNAEFSYYRFLNGDMEEDLWLAMRNGAIAQCNSDGMRKVIWPLIRLHLSPEFVHYIEQAVKNGDHMRLEDPYGPIAFEQAATP